MRPDEFEHKPLESLLRGIEEDHADTQTIKQSLVTRGLDPEEATKEVKSMVSEVLRERRLAWREQAKRNQSVMENIFFKVVSWRNRSRDEIETAFRVATSTGQLQVAHRNLTDLPLDDKAMMLDEIEALKQMNQTPPSADNETK